MPTVLLAGGTGLIGSRLSVLLKEKGYEVLHLSRRPGKDSPFETYQWDVARQTIEEEAITRSDHVVNLAGAGIADKPWTAARKQLIIDSRVDSARLLRNSFERLGHQPESYLSSAAIGYYGSRGDELLDETSVPGDGFLAESCLAWESAIDEVAATGIRTAAFRIGPVLSVQGGAMEKMLLPFHFFVGTYFGDGRQWFSWIHIDDVCRMFIAAIEEEHMAGFYNAVAPHPVTNREMTEALKEALGKPAVLLPVPAFALRLGMGEMADVVLSSAKVNADKVVAAGFEFAHPSLTEALHDLLSRRI